MTRINVKYANGFNTDLDGEIEKIVGKRRDSSGYFIPTGERDLQFEVAEEDASDIINRLRAIGVTAERDKPRAVS